MILFDLLNGKATYLPQIHTRNFLTPSVVATSTTDGTVTAGRIYLQAIDIPVRSKPIALVVSNGSTVAGNITVGLYGPITTPFSPSSEALVATSADVAMSGTLAPQTHAFTTNPVLLPGQYYIAVICSDSTNQLKVVAGSSAAIAPARGYYNSGSYGSLPANLPAITNSSTGSVICGLEIVTVP